MITLVVQIPCYNEEDTLAQTIADVPRQIPGIGRVEIVVIDDGSTDRTAAIAREAGVDLIVTNKRNLGLAATFRAGLHAALARGADIIVNTDGDNQYCGADIAQLVQPILDGRADIVIGDRQTDSIEHFSPRKRLLQKIGSGMVRRFSGVDIPDAVSGFRAISREAALKLNIISPFSYTIEMLIQAGHRGITFTSVPVRTNRTRRQSRLAPTMFRFIERSGMTMLRMYAMYQPLRVFTVIGLFIAAIGAIPLIRFLYFYAFVSGQGKIQSLIIGSAFLTIGALTVLLGVTADLLGNNRQLLEMTLERVRRLEEARFDGERPPPAG